MINIPLHIGRNTRFARNITKNNRVTITKKCFTIYIYKKMFSTFSTFNSNMTKSNILALVKYLVNGIFSGVNPNFNGTTTANNTLINGWTFTTTNSGVLIQTNGSTYWPSSSTNLPAGPNYSTSLTIQSNGYGTATSTSSSYQTVYLTATQHTLSFYAAGRGQSNYFNSSNVFSVSLGGTTLVSNQTVINTNWTLYSYTYTPPSAGNYVLSFDISNGNKTDSSINFINVVIV